VRAIDATLTHRGALDAWAGWVCSKLNHYSFGKWDEIRVLSRLPNRDNRDVAATALELVRFCRDEGVLDADEGYVRTPAAYRKYVRLTGRTPKVTPLCGRAERCVVDAHAGRGCA
jgi:hypothetical protein